MTIIRQNGPMKAMLQAWCRSDGAYSWPTFRLRRNHAFGPCKLTLGGIASGSRWPQSAENTNVALQVQDLVVQALVLLKYVGMLLSSNGQLIHLHARPQFLAGMRLWGCSGGVCGLLCLRHRCLPGTGSISAGMPHLLQSCRGGHLPVMHPQTSVHMCSESATRTCDRQVAADHGQCYSHRCVACRQPALLHTTQHQAQHADSCLANRPHTVSSTCSWRLLHCRRASSCTSSCLRSFL